MNRRFLRRQARRLRRLLFPAFRRRDSIDQSQLEPGLDLLYRFILARPVDEDGRHHYLRLMREERTSLREIGAELAASDEFQHRLRASIGPASRPAVPGASPPPEAPVNVHALASTLTVEQLAQTAEDYYRSTVAFTDRYLAKPFDDPHDAPDLLASFAHLLGGLRLAPGMTVLDFGAGACWTSRALAQFGCPVIALDVSPTALQIGAELFARLPPTGDQPAPRFLVFNGRRIDLPDASVDRIVCFDAFHHVPNSADVLLELGRVLRPGGIAGFSEPGPAHSDAARSQYEMKNYRAFENDVVMADVWRWAQAGGFTGLELAVFSSESHRVTLPEFDDLVAGRTAFSAFDQKLRAFLRSHQTFFLSKGQSAKDSRERDGLRAEIAVHLDTPAIASGALIRGRASVQNVGTATWLPGSTPIGGVNVGVHLRSRDGRPLAVDFRRIPIDQRTAPGENCTLTFALAPPEPGDYLLEFDLVSERIAWFEMNGSPTATLAVTIRA